MLMWMLVACDGLGAGANGGDARIWTANWSDHLVYQSVDAAAVGGTADTASAVETRMDAILTAADGAFTFTVRTLDDAGAGDTLRELTFATGQGLSVTQVDGAALDPAVVLLPATWEEGVATTSGDYTTTPGELGDVVTWYGTFKNVATVTVDGPAGDPLGGVLRFAPDIGLVQFALGDVAGDLVWYDPAASAAAEEEE